MVLIGTIPANVLARTIEIRPHPIAVNIAHSRNQLWQVLFDAAHLTQWAARRPRLGSLHTPAADFLAYLCQILF
jgi:hypothetical protein